jgi:hypothetical protein
MAVQLSIEIRDNGYDKVTNTSSATVNVIATYSAGSHNNGNSDGSLPDGTLYINGVRYDFTATFNSMKQEYGYETIYSQTVAIDRSVTSDVSCSATFDTGVSSGTISASNSITLSDTPQGEGGGDEGDTEEYSYAIYATVGEGTVIKVKGGNGYTPNYDPVVLEITECERRRYNLSYKPYSVIYILAEVINPETHELTKFASVDRNGKEVPIDGYKRVEGNAEYTAVSCEVITEARPKALVHIDDGETFNACLCYINNGEGWELYAPFIDNGTDWEPCY